MRTFTLIVSLCLCACGGADIGEECDDVGKADECVDGAICTNEEGDIARCRAECDEQQDCPAGHNCSGISGTSRKSCQPDDDSTQNKGK